MTLKVLHITTASEPIAGAERLLADIAREEAVVQPSLVTLAPEGELHLLWRASGREAYSLGAASVLRAPSALGRLRALMRNIGPDIVHTHLHHASVLATLAGGAAPIVQTRHYADYMEKFGGGLSRALDGWAARRSSAVIAVSAAARDHLVGVERVPSKNVVVIGNGVDVKALAAIERQTARKALSDQGIQHRMLVGCAATHHPTKGHDVLLAAFSRLSSSRKDLGLILLGGGAGIRKTHSSIKAMGLSDIVHVLGYRADPHRYLAGVDIYVQPSIQEGFGLAVVEAMALGLPVLVSDTGGMRETVEHARSGWKVPPGDPEALAAALELLAADSELRGRLGAAARDRARENFSIETMLARYREIYHRVIDGAGGHTTHVPVSLR